MRKPKLSIRSRILATCLLISVAAVAAMTAYGLGFGQVLRARARENCERTAETFGSVVHDRVAHFDAEVAGLAQALAQDSTPRADRWLPTGTLIQSWAVYDASGRRLAAQHAEGAAESLRDIGLGTAEIGLRERGRLAEALSGRPAVVLVPREEHIYALSYHPIRRPGQPAQALQAAVEITGPTLSLPGQGSDARAILRPFIVSADIPHFVTLGGKARLLVHRPLLYQGHQLGTVAAAVPYDAETRYEQRVTLTVVLVALAALVVLGLVSYLLTDVAMVPLARVRRFIHDLQTGQEVEFTNDIPPDEAGALLEAYQRVRKQSQDWADRLMESNHALNDLVRGAVEALVNAIEAKDGYTAGHSQGVAAAACTLGRRLGWDMTALEHLRIGSLLHDIGKIGIRLDILNKPGVLDPEEFATIREHPVIGARILSAIPGCEEVIRIVLGHHERYNGSGYPSGARGDQIPLSARIVAIADVYDALTSLRSYRPAYATPDALAIIAEGRGTLFDPELVDTFLEVAALSPVPQLGLFSTTEAPSEDQAPLATPSAVS